MDIRLVVARSVAYLSLIILIAMIYASGVLAVERIFFPEALSGFNLAQGALRTVLAVILVFTFQPLRKWITRRTDHLFFKEQYNTEELLNELSHRISSTIVMAELLHKTLDILIEKMKVSRGLYVIFEKERVYTSLSMKYRERVDIEGGDLYRMARRGLVVYDELGESSELKGILRKYKATVSIPLKTEKEVAGVLLLGEKSSGDMFSGQDLKIFEIIEPEIAIAVENAKSYEEIQKFNISLKEGIKKATIQLSEANTHLLELDKAKDEFISMASHQLRTPLTAIKGYLSMLLEGDAGEVKKTQADFLNEAYEGSNKMVALINDLLNVSRMETGRFFLEPKKIDLVDVAKGELKQLETVAGEKSLKISLHAERVPQVFVDEVKIRQVIMNFVDNAIHYSSKGEIVVRIYRSKDDVLFEVHDTGIGIPKDQQKNLFTKFFRADNAREVRPDGTGLGLYLARKVIEEHKGKIIFSSEEGVGSVFGFSFDQAKIKAAVSQN
jgi:signal transduction histidine kinase